MSQQDNQEHIIIGPNPCPECGGEYGEHTKDCYSATTKARGAEEWWADKDGTLHFGDKLIYLGESARLIAAAHNSATAPPLEPVAPKT